MDPDEQWRVIRVRVAERLHQLPAQVDTVSYPDLCDLLEVWRADEAIEKLKAATR